MPIKKESKLKRPAGRNNCDDCGKLLNGWWITKYKMVLCKICYEKSKMFTTKK
jgi:hypothetical protein